VYGIVTVAIAVVVLPALFSDAVIAFSTVLYAVVAAALVVAFEIGRNFFVAAADAVEVAGSDASAARDAAAELERQFEYVKAREQKRALARETASRLDGFLRALIRRLPEEEAGVQFNLEQWVENLNEVVRPMHDAVPDELKPSFQAGDHPYASLADIRVEALNLQDSITHYAFYG
jgi:hypothetical protein